MSGDLVAFLRARLNEDQYLAGKFEFTGQSEWDADLLARLWWFGPSEQPQSRSATDPIIQHVARHDPARVLREVEAKRKILTLIRIAREMTDTEPLETDIDRASAGAIIATGHMVLIALATVYRDHPDYRQEWAP